MDLNFKEQIAAKSDEELLEIYIDAENYQENYVTEVITQLKSRKVDLSNLSQAKQQKQAYNQEQFEKGREGNQTFIVIGFVLAALGGIFGIAIGAMYCLSTHADYTGKKYYVYNKETRSSGRIMLIIGLFVPVLALIFALS